MRLLILSRNEELYSTRSIFRAARRRNHFVRVIDHMACDIQIGNGHHTIYYGGEQLTGYDAIIPRIGHTVTRQGAAIILQFETMGVHSSLRSEALIRTRDKLTCLQILSSHGIPIPKTLQINGYDEVRRMHHKIPTFPKIIKLQSGTHGLGVIKANDAETLESMLEAFADLRQKMLIQEFIKESSGVDIRAFVVGGEVVASMMRTAQPGEFRSNLHRGGTGQPVILTEEEREVAIQSTALMGLDVAGVDMLRSHQGPKVIEVNASPGLEGIETYTRVDVSKKIIEYLEQIVKRKLKYGN